MEDCSGHAELLGYAEPFAFLAGERNFPFPAHLRICDSMTSRGSDRSNLIQQRGAH